MRGASVCQLKPAGQAQDCGDRRYQRIRNITSIRNVEHTSQAVVKAEVSVILIGPTSTRVVNPFLPFFQVQRLWLRPTGRESRVRPQASHSGWARRALA